MKIDSKKMEKALTYLNKVNPAAYAQLLLLPFGPVPGYAWEDPNHEWWSSEEANHMYQSIKDAFKDGPKPGGPTRTIPGAKYSYQTHVEGKSTVKKTKLKEFVKAVIREIHSNEGIHPDKLKHSECPRCQNKITILKNEDPILWGCDKCGHMWPGECPECGGKGFTPSMDGNIKCGSCGDLNEDHGDVHYWGAQPKEKQYKISTGYNETPKMKK
jgi:ribosomal protein L37AE/L43A